MRDPENRSSSLLLRIINQKEINFLLTGAFGLFTVYCMLIALFYRNLFQPLKLINLSRIIENGSAELLFHIANNDDNGGSEDSMSLLTNYGNRDYNADADSVISPLSHDTTHVPHGSKARNGTSKMRAGCGVGSAVVGNFPTNGRGVTWLGDSDDSIELLAQTIISLFILWMFALVLGRFTAYFAIPSLFGATVAGIVFANVVTLHGILEIHQKWADVTRQVAFILCLIRCGLAVNFNELKKTWRQSAAIAVISATSEVFVVVLSVTLILDIPFEIAVIFALVLGANSPPLTIPAMVSLEKRGYSVKGSIPALMTNAVAVDNTYCVMSFIAISTLVFRQEIQDPVSVMARISSDLIIGIGAGIFTGMLLRIFPCQRASMMHFTRAALLFTTSCSFIFGSLALHRKIIGPVAVLALSITTSASWRLDNCRGVRREAKTMKTIWDLLFQPLTFALIGVLIDFSALSRGLLIKALITLFFAFVGRLIAGYFAACTIVKELTVKERIFVAFSFVPKATAQAIIFPFMVGYCSIEPHTRFVALTAVLSILLTSPMSRLMNGALGSFLLSKCRANSDCEDPPRPHISTIEHRGDNGVVPVNHPLPQDAFLGAKFGKLGLQSRLEHINRQIEA